MRITRDDKLKALRPYYGLNNIFTMRDIVNQSKGYFFSESTMRFFKSRLVEDIYPTNGRVYFVTSEKFMDNDRLYTVRLYDLASKGVKTVGGFQAFSKLIDAKHYALTLAYEGTLKGDI